MAFLDAEKIFRVTQVIDDMISRLIVHVTVKRLVVHLDCIGDTLGSLFSDFFLASRIKDIGYLASFGADPGRT